MNDEFFKIIGIVLFLSFLAYIIVKSMKLNGRIIESFSLGGDSSSGTSSLDSAKSGSSSFGSSSSSSNLAGGAADYASKINKAVSALKDAMNVPKYRSDYENVILQLDDLIGLSTLQTIMSIDPTNSSSVNTAITQLSNFGQARNSLDMLMRFTDGIQ
jgi:hypothetical protein